LANLSIDFVNLRLTGRTGKGEQVSPIRPQILGAASSSERGVTG